MEKQAENGVFGWSDPPSETAFPIARPGYPFIGAAAFATLVFALLEMPVLAIAGLLVTAGICLFFRDPDRLIPVEPGAVVSPADGTVIAAGPDESGRLFDGASLKVSVFMSLLNVHVNRVPHEGIVESVDYSPGRFFRANLDKASRDNEQNAVVVQTESGHRIGFIQIAGLIARRIVFRLQPRQALRRGQRFGMICFGSRLDVYLPVQTRLTVSVGDRVLAGTSILGYLPEEN